MRGLPMPDWKTYAINTLQMLSACFTFIYFFEIMLFMLQEFIAYMSEHNRTVFMNRFMKWYRDLDRQNKYEFMTHIPESAITDRVREEFSKHTREEQLRFLRGVTEKYIRTLSNNQDPNPDYKNLLSFINLVPDHMFDEYMGEGSDSGSNSMSSETQSGHDGPNLSEMVWRLTDEERVDIHRRLAEEIGDTETRTIKASCSICMKDECEFREVFVPCGHVCVCSGCMLGFKSSKNKDKCPLCRVNIDSTVVFRTS